LQEKELKSMEILTASAELSTEDKYYLTMSPDIQKMSDQQGQVLDIDKWLIYSDANEDKNAEAKEQQILSIMTKDGEVFATNSPTFIKDFQKLVDLFNSSNERVEKIEIISGLSKAGRTFITCKYAK
jgi:hypothetical protein